MVINGRTSLLNVFKKCLHNFTTVCNSKQLTIGKKIKYVTPEIGSDTFSDKHLQLNLDV